MKKLFSLIIFALLPLMASAHDAKIDGVCYDFDTSAKTAKVTYEYYSMSGRYSGNVSIPETVTYNGATYNVTAIGEEAFGYCYSLTSVDIPKSVTAIANTAFYSSPSLTSIAVASGNTIYDSRDNCNAIIETASNTLIIGCSKTIIPNSVTSIGEKAFIRCSFLTTITIPNSVKSIGDMAFYSSSITSIIIPNSVTSIGSGAFSGCVNLTSVTIPSSVTQMGNQPFGGCTNLTSISVESGNTIYDSRDNCNAIIETASNTLLKGCNNTVIPNSVTTIGSNAFMDCSGITSITFPNSVTTIGRGAFERCTELTSITIPNSVTTIGNRSFYNCRGLTSVTISNSVTEIGEELFYACSNLTSVTIPNSVTKIGRWAFNSCFNLVSITIPNNVTSIGEQAFLDCRSLASVTIPNSVTEIGHSTFQFCRSLTEVSIPSSMTKIPERIFSGCTSLTSVTIPNSIESIGGRAFEVCSALTDVYCYAENVPVTESDVFSNSPIYSATLHVPAASVDAYKSTSPWSEFGTIVALDDKPEVKKCATPYIAFYNGKLIFGCATPDVTYVCKLSNIEFETDGTDVSLILPSKITLAVYATKEGYEPSDPLTQEIDPRLLLDKRGDVNLDGEISMQDIMYIVQYILNGKYPDQ